MSRPPHDGRPLRVLMVTGAYAPEISSGGLQTQMVARAAGHRVALRVLTTAVDPALQRHAVVDGVPVSRIVVDVTSRRSKLQATDEMIRELVGLLRASDVVHLHGYSSKNLLVTPIAKLLRVPIILSLHTSGFDEPAAIAGHGRLARWTFDAARLYLCVSPLLADTCRTAGISPARIRYVPNGVEVDRFRPAAPGERAALRQSLGMEPDRPVILFVGFFSRDKQPHVLFDAWLQLQHDPRTVSTLLLVGATQSAYFEVDDRLAHELRTRAQHEGVADRLVFVEPTHRIAEYYRAADVFVLPSIREGLPVALLEAMATGLAVVASRLPGSTDAVIDAGETGLLVAPGDPGAFADAIGRLLTDPERAAAFGEAARRRVATDFSAERVASRWVDAYRDVTTIVA
jgi:glycosyltransferase involved in cell wall biosynthesis